MNAWTSQLTYIGLHHQAAGHEGYRREPKTPKRGWQGKSAASALVRQAPWGELDGGLKPANALPRNGLAERRGPSEDASGTPDAQIPAVRNLKPVVPA